MTEKRTATDTTTPMTCEISATPTTCETCTTRTTICPVCKANAGRGRDQWWKVDEGDVTVAAYRIAMKLFPRREGEFPGIEEQCQIFSIIEEVFCERTHTWPARR